MRLPVAHVEALEVLAAREDRTVSAQIRMLIRRHVESGDTPASTPRRRIGRVQSLGGVPIEKVRHRNAESLADDDGDCIAEAGRL